MDGKIIHQIDNLNDFYLEFAYTEKMMEAGVYACGIHLDGIYSKRHQQFRRFPAKRTIENINLITSRSGVFVCKHTLPVLVYPCCMINVVVI